MCGAVLRYREGKRLPTIGVLMTPHVDNLENQLQAYSSTRAPVAWDLAALSP